MAILKSFENVVKKTMDTAETIKLKGIISDEEKRLDCLFNQLGKKYFELFARTYEAELEPIIVDIKTAQAKIKSSAEQIMQLRGMVTCHNCKETLPKGSAFCSYCGEKISVIACEERTRICATCGEAVAPNIAFCTNCGTEIEETGESKPICKNCGSEMVDGAVFCVICGAKAE